MSDLGLILEDLHGDVNDAVAMLAKAVKILQRESKKSPTLVWNRPVVPIYARQVQGAFDDAGKAITERRYR